MDTISEELEENVKELMGVGQTDSLPTDGAELSDDIQFEEVIDIDEIQKQLSEELTLEKSGLVKASDSDTDGDESSNLGIIKMATLVDPNCKKYVIYIDPENIDYMEEFSINERKDIVNKILKEQNERSINAKKVKETARFVKHAILVCVTVLITFPAMFVLANKALEVTIKNCTLSKQNFTKLYKEQGKIKMQDTNTIPDVKY